MATVTATATVITAYVTAGKHVRSAMTALQQLGHVMGTDTHGTGHLLATLDTVARTIADRVELEKDRAAKQAAAPAADKRTAVFDKAAFVARASEPDGIPGFAGRTDTVKEATYRLWLASGLSVAAFFGLTPEQRQAMHRAQQAAQTTPAPKPAAKAPETPKPVAKAPKAAKPTATDKRDAGKADRPQCKATKADGTPCQSRVIVADGLCRVHLDAKEKAKPAAAPQATPTAKPATPTHPVAGTVLVADGKGGFRTPTAADEAALWAALEKLTARKAA